MLARTMRRSVQDLTIGEEFEQGVSLEYARDRIYWARNGRSNLGQEQLRSPPLRILSRGQVASEAFKAGASIITKSNTSRVCGDGSTISPPSTDGRVKKEILHDGEPSKKPPQGWHSTRGAISPREPAACGSDRVVFSTFKLDQTRTSCIQPTSGSSLFPNTTWRRRARGSRRIETASRSATSIAPASSTSPIFFVSRPGERRLGVGPQVLNEAYDLLLAAGCKRDGRR